jgi:hypothetical protein
MTRLYAGILLSTAACVLAVTAGALVLTARVQALYAESRCMTSSDDYAAAIDAIRAHGAEYRTLADLMEGR